MARSTPVEFLARDSTAAGVELGETNIAEASFGIIVVILVQGEEQLVCCLAHGRLHSDIYNMKVPIL